MGEIGEREKEIEVIRGIIISTLVMLVSFPLAANEHRLVERNAHLGSFL